MSSPPTPKVYHQLSTRRRHNVSGAPTNHTHAPTDRKAAAAMSSLDVKTEEQDDSAAPKKEVDQKALAEAMKFLSVGQDSNAAVKKTAEGGKKKDAEPPKPLLKVDAADVALLVEQLDLPKARATDLLRANEADVEKAMGAWVVAGV